MIIRILFSLSLTARYSDGSWKKVGKELGSGFAGIGKTMLHTVGIGEGNKPEDKNTDSGEN